MLVDAERGLAGRDARFADSSAMEHTSLLATLPLRASVTTHQSGPRGRERTRVWTATLRSLVYAAQPPALFEIPAGFTEKAGIPDWMLRRE